MRFLQAAHSGYLESLMWRLGAGKSPGAAGTRACATTE